jgi:hypothetical protein
VTTQFGFTRSELGGDLALADAGTTATVQGVGSAFGLGDEHGSPFVRLVADCDGPVFSASGFWLHDEGAGVLAASFGGLPAATPVTSDIDLGVLQIGGVYEFDVGPVTLAPGAAFDLFALDFRVEQSPGNREEIDEILGLPLLFVWASWPLPDPLHGVRATAELGWLDLGLLGGDDQRFLDLHAQLEWHPGGQGHFFGGYRRIAVDAEGGSDQTVLLDLTLQGWFVGIGFAF